MKSFIKKFSFITISLFVVSLFIHRAYTFSDEQNIEKPTISVIVPVYNAENDLDKSLETIENQTFEDIEIICVDDGSSDNSLDILEKHARKDGRIKIIEQENQGAAEARNAGLKAARGEYIYFCDSDDYVLPYTLEKCMDIFNKYEGLDAVEFGVSRIDYQNEVNLDDYIYDDCYEDNLKLLKCAKGDNPFEVFKTRGWGVWKYVYKKSFLENNNLKFKNGLRTNEDVLFGFLAMSCMKQIARDSNIGYIYRINRPGSVSTYDCKIAKKSLESFIKIINEIMENRERFNFIGSDEYILNYMTYIIINRVKNINPPEDRQHYAKTVYNNLMDKFITKYNVKTDSKNSKRLSQLKLWATNLAEGQEQKQKQEKCNGSIKKNAGKRKNKKLQHNSSHRSRKIHACR